SVAIENGVANLGTSAFGGTGLTSIAVPGSVSSLVSAFVYCYSLTNATIEDGLTGIGDYAFYFCTNLASVTIPASVTNIGTDAFSGTRLVNVAVPGSTSTIGDSAFEGLLSLTNATLANGLVSIGNSAFEGCNLTNVTIPASVTNIGTNAFSGNPLTSVAFPGGVATINDYAFAYCNNLTNVTLANGVSAFGSGAFENTGLASVTIPASVSAINYWAFYNCTSMTSFYFEGDALSVDWSTFGNENNPIFYYLPGANGWSDFAANTGFAAVLWNPLVQTSDGSFGVRINLFGFNITGTNNFTVVVAACANLASPVWVPLTTNTLIAGSFYFSDPQWTNYPNRYYILQMP
ncbi:MAG TPA: leucine-rich repeat domain-containing protein, partial [Candidatus Acidoferrum sp.]|nr:leucine-rich repeat domain-containing protein [Candidatus Acidoferrum sp.]